MTRARKSWEISLIGAVLAAATLFAGSPAMAESAEARIAEGRYVYAIKHDSRGDIGRVINDVRVEGKRVTIASRERIEVKVLGLVAYRQSANRTEVWDGAELIRFTARTDADGKVSTVLAARDGGALKITGTSGALAVSGKIAPANPWRIEATATGRLIDVNHGAIKSVKVVEIGAARISVAGRKVTTRHFRISGDLRREVWYDGTGLAVKLRFFHKGDVIDMDLIAAPALVPQNAQR